MGAAEVIDTLEILGISLRSDGNKLLLEPGSKVPSDLVSQVRRYKPEILELLATPREFLTSGLLAWAALAAETGLTLPEPEHFLETPLRPYTTNEVGRYCRDRLKCLAMARSNKVTGGWGRFTPEWWTEMETQSIQALAALKASIDETDTQEAGP